MLAGSSNQYGYKYVNPNHKTSSRSPKPYSPPQVFRILGIWRSYYNVPKARFYLLKGDYNPKPLIPASLKSLEADFGAVSLSRGLFTGCRAAQALKKRMLIRGDRDVGSRVWGFRVLGSGLV